MSTTTRWTWLPWLLILTSTYHPTRQLTVAQRVPACEPAPPLYPQSVCNCQSTSQGTEVNCPSRNPKLTWVPLRLPEDTSVLNLVNNSITTILKGHLDKLERVRTIFLQSNRILSIEGGAFSNLYNLQLLVLSGNLLTMITDSVFQHLPSIRIIDLSNNRITRIERRAFLTLPASTSDSVNIQLSGNRIICNCEIRALRDWSKSLPSTLTQIQFTGFQCLNAGGRELDSLTNQEFGCAGAPPSLFETSQQCVSCRSMQTQHTCDDVREALCGAQQPVCLSQIKVTNGKLAVYKSCGAYTDCLLRSRNNYRLCNVSHSADTTVNAVDCTFCCSGPVCNRVDMGGRTRSFQLYVGTRLSQTFQSYMLQPQDSRYTQQANIFVQKLNELFQGLEGSYETKFHSFQNLTGKVYVTCLVHVSVLNTLSVNEAARLMLGVLNQTLQNDQSFMRQQGADRFYVGTELVTTKRCPQEVTQTPQGPIRWPETQPGVTIFVSCPASQFQRYRFGNRTCVLDKIGVAKWRDPNVGACQKTETNDRLEELNSTDITPNNVNDVLTQLEQLTSDGPKLTPAGVALSVGMVERAMSQGSALSSASGTQSSLQVLSNVLDAEDSVLVQADKASQSATRLLAAADRIGAEGKLDRGGQLLVTSPNMAVGALAVDSDSFQGATLTARTPADHSFVPGDIEIQPKSTTPARDLSSLVVPPTLLKSSPGSRLAMKALVSDKVFKVIQQSKSGAVSQPRSNRQVNSHVLDATVVGHNVSNLADPVTMTFVHLNENATNPSCTFWNVRNSRWSSEGCSLDTELSTNDTTSCRCDHLTNFALLMDVYGASLSETDKRVLSIISYIGCGVSLLALLLTLLTYILFKKLRRDNPSKILVNLCVALALSNLVFVAGMQPYALDNLVGCKIVAVLLHFSLLSALCWMAVEAFYMYLALVLVFKTYFTNFLLKCSLIGWGIPLLTVAITLGVNKTDNYGPLDSGVCWLKDLAFYIAFVGPVGLILVINFLAFGLVLRQILGLAGRKLNKSDSFSVAQRLRGAVGVAILLGLTWIFALFAIDRASVVFYYLFAIFNSLQGLWIFVFYCLLKKEARSAWRRALPCCPALDKSVISNTRDKHDQYSNSRSAQMKKAGYSTGTGLKTECSKSSTDNGLTTTTAFTSSSMDSEGAYGSEQTNQQKPKGVESSQVHIKLADKGDQVNSDTQPPANQPTRTVHRSEGNVTLPAVVPKGTQASPPVNISPGPVTGDTKLVVQKGNGDAQASPPPLHFKVGYTLSNTSSNNSTDMSQSDAPNSDDSRQSVAELIKKMNNTRM